MKNIYCYFFLSLKIMIPCIFMYSYFGARDVETGGGHIHRNQVSWRIASRNGQQQDPLGDQARFILHFC